MKILIQQLEDKLLGLDELGVESSLRGKAAVLVALFEGQAGPEILLTRRAKALNQHGGEVAFPGGMWEQGDQFPLQTALRESEEEIALNAERVRLLGGLPIHQTAFGVEVTPVVGLLDEYSKFTPNPDEIESIFSVPVSFFIKDQRLRTDIFQRQKSPEQPALQRWVPAYHYQGYEIWGFTASVIVTLLNRCLGANITRANTAAERRWYNGKLES